MSRTLSKVKAVFVIINWTKKSQHRGGDSTANFNSLQKLLNSFHASQPYYVLETLRQDPSSTYPLCDPCCSNENSKHPALFKVKIAIIKPVYSHHTNSLIHLN